jgi:ankyrin repeat protein
LNGADVNLQNNTGKTPLIYAVEQNNLDIVKVLIAAGLNKDAALLYATKNNNLNLVKTLLKWGVNANLQDETGKTVLLYAMENNNLDMVRALIAAGADVNLQDETGKTALKLALTDGSPDMVKALLKGYVDVNFLALKYAMDQSNQEMLTYLMQKVTETKFSALVYAMENNNLDMVRALIAAGADVNLQDKTGKTALMAAAELGNDEVVSYLLENGADVSLIDRNGETAISLSSLDQTIAIFEENKKLREAMVSGNVEAFKDSDYDKISKVRVPILSGRWDKFKWALVERGSISEDSAGFKSQSFHELLLGNEALLRKYIKGTSDENKIKLGEKCTDTQLDTLDRVGCVDPSELSDETELTEFRNGKPIHKVKESAEKRDLPQFNLSKLIPTSVYLLASAIDKIGALYKTATTMLYPAQRVTKEDPEEGIELMEISKQKAIPPTEKRDLPRSNLSKSTPISVYLLALSKSIATMFRPAQRVTKEDPDKGIELIELSAQETKPLAKNKDFPRSPQTRVAGKSNPI